MRRLATVAIVLFAISVTHGQTEQVESGNDSSAQELTPEKKAAKHRLDFMFSSAAGFSGKRKSDGAEIKIFEKPLLRFTNPLHGCREGLFVAWVDPANRPLVVGQVFLMRNTANSWYIETQSLGEGPLQLTSPKNGSWNPREPGIKWTKFEGEKALEPAKTKAVRLGQMRQLARRFDGEDDLSTKANRLRLMPNPMVRYEDEKNGTLDGALFAMVEGTDPELLIQIETRPNKNGDHEYWWALAPMTSAKLEGYLDGRRVWSKPQMSGSSSQVFYMRPLTGGVPYPIE